ncbi:MAG: ferrous iron transporter B [Planctomycetota bacterium]|jgi:ferrous iron transport protein B
MSAAASSTATAPLRVGLVGPPNSGKTSLFIRLTGLHAKTGNFSGTTLERQAGTVDTDYGSVEFIDFPGLYSLEHFNNEELVTAKNVLSSSGELDAVVVVLDASNVARALYLASEVRELGIPMVAALTMKDAADRQGIDIDAGSLSESLGAPIVPLSSRTGEGLEALHAALGALVAEERAGERSAAAASAMSERVACASCSGCSQTDRHVWAGQASAAASTPPDPAKQRVVDAADRLLTHPLLGLGVFAALMIAVFALLFKAATYPMDLIDGAFGAAGGWLANALPEGLFSSFLVDGIFAGVGGAVVFLPQICLLFFALSLLEDSGYLARAAVIADRLMSKVGLPGKAFIPMLSAHACAIPGIMATRSIESKRQRFITILVIPFLSCSARLPVYAMITALLFTDEPLLAGAVFFGAYTLGISAALIAAAVLSRTLLEGPSDDLVIEFPAYRWPSLRVAAQQAWDRGKVFLKQAGSVIVVISMVLWVFLQFPQTPPDQLPASAPEEARALHQEALESARGLEARLARLEADDAARAALEGELEAAVASYTDLHGQYAAGHSLAGRAGRLLEPVFRPLGFDWRINLGVAASFAAREAVVPTLSIVAGVGEEAAEESGSLVAAMRSMKRLDGSPLFDLATTLSLLVFFVLAMQCLPTQAVTRRETGSWKWAALQLGYMSATAYGAALITYQIASAV